MRRMKDKNKHRHGGQSLADASAKDFSNLDIVPADTGVIDVISGQAQPAASVESEHEYDDYSPIVIREKVFAPKRMTPDEAVDHMELLGHDFFLFIEKDTERPAVVYRRRGWDYGVIALGDEGESEE